jgi:hypothetical protein
MLLFNGIAAFTGTEAANKLTSSKSSMTVDLADLINFAIFSPF